VTYVYIGELIVNREACRRSGGGCWQWRPEMLRMLVSTHHHGTTVGGCCAAHGSLERTSMPHY
jgi:hypothetical protein